MKRDIYLIAHHYKVPRNPNATSQKGFGKDENNWQWNEEVSFKQKINKKDNMTATVILGLHQKKIIRSSMNPTATFDELYNYFYQNGYKDYLDRVKQAEDIVAKAVEEAMKEMKDTNTDPTTFHFPKAADFEVKPTAEEFADFTPIKVDQNE
jgi:hypothetical protein